MFHQPVRFLPARCSLKFYVSHLLQVYLRNLRHSQLFEINGAHVPNEARLYERDMIQFGRHTFRFEGR